MLAAFHGPVTFIKLLSVLAFFTTVGLFFCGIPICRQIWKRQDTAEISGAPFLMGVLGGMCWFVYGKLKGDLTVMYVTGAQIVLYSIYTVFFWFMSKKKLAITIKIVVLLAVCGSLLAMTNIFGHAVFHPLGIICMTLNTMDFAAPLAGLRVVYRRKATSTLPLPLCIANFLVSTEWFIYGLLVWDFYLITPNGIGSLLAFSQLILFIVLPRKPMQRAPFLRLWDCLRSCCRCCRGDSLDLEAAAVVTAPAEKKSDPMVDGIDTTLGGIHRMSSRLSNKHRWSSRVLTNVVGEVENVIHKVHGDPFGYKLNKEEEEGSTDSGTLTPVDEKAPVSALTAGAPAPTEHAAPVEPEVQLNMFEQSARSIGKRISNELRAARGFARSHGSIKGAKEEDEEQLEQPDEDEDEDGLDDHEEEYGEEEYEADLTAHSQPELVFPMTIQDANQLARLSRRLSSARRKKPRKQKSGSGRLGFACSLQPGHFRALRRAHASPAGAPAEILPPVLEEQLQQQQKKNIKRAQSVPNIYEEQQP